MSRRLIWIALAVSATVTSLLVGAAWLHVGRIAADLPQLPEDPAHLSLRAGTEIYAASGERIFTFNENRKWTRLVELPPHAIQALLATEDAGFYEHNGIDPKAIMAAVWANVTQGLGARGGSTLTQQLVKRLFLSPERTIERKVGEMLLALQLEAHFARHDRGMDSTAWAPAHPIYKDRILELYLNTVFFGANSYGIGDAAETFFSKDPADLTVAEAALLVGLPNAPSAYNPLRHPDRATRRMRHVLDRMKAVGVLTPEQWASASQIAADDLLDSRGRPLNPTPYWAEAARAEVISRWGEAALRYGGLRIYTTLDMRLQQAAEAAVDSGLVVLDERFGFAPYDEATPDERAEYVQAALVCLDPHRGHVQAMVGGRDIFVSHYNRALWARRQPGSAFKPLLYLAALEAGAITPVSLFVDEQRSYEVNDEIWSPRNFGDRYLGLTTAAWALINSANSTAVQVFYRVGPEPVLQMVKALGVGGDLQPYPSIALGAQEMTVMELASAYGTMAASGIRVDPTLVDRITDTSGRLLFEHRPAVRQVVSPERAYELVQLLRQVVDRGTGRRVRALGLDRDVAGKTGTTNDNTDAWFTGFSPELVTSVWVGFDDRRQHRLVDVKGQQITGGTGALPIWTQFIKQAVNGSSPSRFSVPADVRLELVDPTTGMAVTEQSESESEPDAPRPIGVALADSARANEWQDVERVVAEADSARSMIHGAEP